MPNAPPETTVQPRSPSWWPSSAGDVLAVRGRRPRADDRHRAVDQLVQPGRAAHPQRDRRHRRDRPVGLVLRIVGLLGHGDGRGRAAAGPATRRPRGRPAGRRSARRARRSARLSSCCARAPTSARIRSGARPERSRRTAVDRADVVDVAPEVDRARLAGPAEPGPGPPQAGGVPADRAAPPRSSSRRHAATRCSRMPSASATSSVPGDGPAGEVGERPGDPEHAVEAADRQRPALQRPLGQPQRRPRHRPALAEQPAGHLAVDREPGAAPAAPPPRPARPAPAARPSPSTPVRPCRRARRPG